MPPIQSMPPIRIEGTGPVAFALALLLRRQGVPAETIALTPPETELAPGLGDRVLALGKGSWDLLSRIVPCPAAAPILTVNVQVHGHGGRTRLNASDLGLPALGWVTRYRDLHSALAQSVQRQPFNRTTACQDDHVIVHAGGNPGRDALVRSFDQAAITAEIGARSDAAGAAYERFTDEGPLALLPLPQAHRFGLVWCATAEQSRRRLECGEKEFLAELYGMLGPDFRDLRLHGAREYTELLRRERRDIVTQREVWIGNAAQSLHPVAGQGLGLGLRDAYLLSRALGRLVRRPTDHSMGHGTPSPAEALRQYERERRLDRRTAISVTDQFARLFTHPRLHPVQSIALTALDLVSPLRNQLARQMMYGLR